jgi:hypothetical protein
MQRGIGGGGVKLSWWSLVVVVVVGRAFFFDGPFASNQELHAAVLGITCRLMLSESAAQESTLLLHAISLDSYASQVRTELRGKSKQR